MIAEPSAAKGRASYAFRSEYGRMQTACKPGSVTGHPIRADRTAGRRPFLWDDGHPPPRATNPGGGRKPLRVHGRGHARAAPIRSCSRWGLPCHPRCRGRGALLPHRFTLARCGMPDRAVCSLWHCPWGRPRRALPGTVLPWSPDFPPSAAAAAAKSGRPAVCAADIGCWHGGRKRGGKRKRVQVGEPFCSTAAGRRRMMTATPTRVSTPPTAIGQVTGSPRSRTPPSTPKIGSSSTKGIVWATL